MLVWFSRSMLNKIFDKIKLPFRKEKELYLSLYLITGLIPHDISYYKTALLHKSVSRRNEKGKLVNNERLEFLGDAVLDCVVADIVYERFPNKREGFLTNTRSKLVKRETLNKVSTEMGIDKMLKQNGHTVTHNCNVAGNAFEALVGALYLDHGYDACMNFMRNRVFGHLVNVEKMAYREMNYKSKLIEWTQKNKVTVIFDEVNTSTDENGNPVFLAQVIIGNVRCEEGKGFTKKESQQNAAKQTYRRIRKEPSFVELILTQSEAEIKTEETVTEPLLTATSEPIEQKEDTMANGSLTTELLDETTENLNNSVESSMASAEALITVTDEQTNTQEVAAHTEA